MHLVAHLKAALTGLTASWVMWLLLALSVVSLVLSAERGLFFRSIRADVRSLARSLDSLLRSGRYQEAAASLRASSSVEAAIALAGLLYADMGPASAEKAIEGATALQRKRMERGLAFLGTLGNNAPFVGLLGTVIGVIEAFEALGSTDSLQQMGRASSSLAPQAIMSGIAEALVATAIGLFVAIPAVAANNYFQRRVQTTLAESEALNSVLLAHLLAEDPVLPEPPSAALTSGAI